MGDERRGRCVKRCTGLPTCFRVSNELAPLPERFAITSPWTLSLSNALRSLLEEQALAEMDEYSSALHRQLQDCGRVLLRQMRAEIQDRFEAVSRIVVAL